MVDPRVVADLARSLDPRRTRRGDSIESSPPRPPPAHGAAGRGVERAGPHPGGTTGLEEAHLASRWSWVVVPAQGRSPRADVVGSPYSMAPGARPARPAGRAPGTSSGQSGEQPPGPGHHGPVRSRSARTGRTPAPDSRNRRATSRPSTGPFPSSAALNRRQSLHQGSHKPLNTPQKDGYRGHRGLRRHRRRQDSPLGHGPDQGRQEGLRQGPARRRGASARPVREAGRPRSPSGGGGPARHHRGPGRGGGPGHGRRRGPPARADRCAASPT